MKLSTETKKADLAYLQQLAHRCLERVQDLYPTTWKTIILQTYQPQIEIIMQAKGMDMWEAAVELYNGANDPNELRRLDDKIFFMAAVKNMASESVLQQVA